MPSRSLKEMHSRPCVPAPSHPNRLYNLGETVLVAQFLTCHDVVYRLLPAACATHKHAGVVHWLQ